MTAFAPKRDYMIKAFCTIFFCSLFCVLAFADDESILVEVNKSYTVIEKEKYKLELWNAIDHHFHGDIPPLTISGDISFEEYSEILLEAQKRNLKIGLITKPKEAE